MTRFGTVSDLWEVSTVEYHASYRHRGVGPGVGGLKFLKICVGGVSFAPSPQRVTFFQFHSKLLLDKSASFTSSRRMKDLVSKWKLKLIFRAA